MKWIPVSERLPETYKDVLIYSEFGGCQKGFLHDHGDWEDDCGYDKKITHWQPLPDPPEES